MLLEPALKKSSAGLPHFLSTFILNSQDQNIPLCHKGSHASGGMPWKCRKMRLEDPVSCRGLSNPESPCAQREVPVMEDVATSGGVLRITDVTLQDRPPSGAWQRELAEEVSTRGEVTSSLHHSGSDGWELTLLIACFILAPKESLPLLLVAPVFSYCQLQIGTCHGHLPSASTGIKSCSAVAADLQHPLKGVQSGQQK